MRTRLPTALLLCVLALQAIASGPPDAELQQLTSALRNAKTQADMNLASKKLADYWNARLAATQAKIESRLDAKERKEFARSNNRWQSYRAGEVAFRASFYEGGSIQSLVANTAYSEITEYRASELESLFADGLAWRGEPRGPANRSQPVRPKANRTSAESGSGR